MEWEKQCADTECFEWLSAWDTGRAFRFLCDKYRKKDKIMNDKAGYFVVYWDSQSLRQMHMIFYRTSEKVRCFIERRMENFGNTVKDFTVIQGTCLNVREGVVIYG